MKILLIGINAKYIHPAIAIYQLKANTAYNVVTKEFTIKDSHSHILDIMNNEKYDLIGFSCYIWNITMVNELIKSFRISDKKTKILLGGPEVSYNPEEYLKSNLVDYVISGEGEVAFDYLLSYLDGKKSISAVPNLVYKSNNNIIYNYKALPDLQNIKLATLDIPDLEKRIIYLESSRGCPYHCSYCVASIDNKVRFFPIDEVLYILKTLLDRRVKTVKFLDRTFNANKTYLKTILDYVEINNIDTIFQFEIVVDQLTPDMIEMISNYEQSQLRFEVGIQTLNETVNKAVRRNQNNQLLKENIKLLNTLEHIDLHVDLIAGLPKETLPMFINSFNETFLLKPKELQLGFLKFLKGTHMMELAEQYGYIYDKLPPYEIIENMYMTSSDLAQIHQVEATLEKFYNSGRFKKTWATIFEKGYVTDFYHFFNSLYEFSRNRYFNFVGYQLADLYILLDDYWQEYLPNDYNFLHFILIQDYLENTKVKPKIWWKNTIDKKMRHDLYDIIVQKIPSIDINDLFKSSVVVAYEKNIYICLYKNYKMENYLISE